jgi:nitroreductase
MMDTANVDHALTTTRTVRKRLDLTRPVDSQIIRQCIEIATFAPSGSNRQGWHFVVIDDPEVKRQIGAIYKRSFDLYLASQRGSLAKAPAADPARTQLEKVLDSATYLSEHMGEVPALILVCADGRTENAGPMAQAAFYGSVLPAAWSLMIALNARGIGSAWTTLHLRYESEAAAVLGIPDTVTQAVLIPIGYLKDGPSGKAARKPAADRTYWNRWGQIPKS